MSRASSENKEVNGKRKPNVYERAIIRYDKVNDGLTGTLTNLRDCLEDDFRPNTGLSFVLRDDGGYLVIIKRMDGLKKELMMAYGEDIIDALLAIDKRLGSAEWKVDIPWDQKVAKKKSNQG